MPGARSSDDARRRLAIYEAQKLAKKLQGLTSVEAEMVIQAFLKHFLERVIAQNGLGQAQLLCLAHIPIDCVLPKEPVP